MENKKLSNVDLESTDYDPAQVGNLDRRLEVGKKDAVFFHVLGVVDHSDRHHLDVRLRNRRSRRDEVLSGHAHVGVWRNRDLSGHVCGGHDLAGQMGGVSADRKV